MTSTNSQGLKDIQIDAIQFEHLIVEERKQLFNEGLYCGRPDHKATNCQKKCKQHYFKTRAVHILKNEYTQPQYGPCD